MQYSHVNTPRPRHLNPAGEVAVVPGGSGEIGAATCRLLAANYRAKVAVNGRDETEVDAVVDAIRSAGGETAGAAADHSDVAAIERMRHRVEQHSRP